MIGTGLTIAGSAISVIAISEENNDIAILGGVLALSGFIMEIVGHSNLMNAGKAMKNDQGLSVVSNKNGIGLAYKF